MLFFKLQYLYFDDWHVYKQIEWHLELIKIEFILFGIIDNILNTMSFDVLLKTMKEFIYTLIKLTN